MWRSMNPSEKAYYFRQANEAKRRFIESKGDSQFKQTPRKRRTGTPPRVPSQPSFKVGEVRFYVLGIYDEG